MDLLQSASLFESYLVDASGKVLVHIDKSSARAPASITDHPLLSRAISLKNSGVSSYQLSGQKWYGAYAPLGIGSLFFLTQAHESQVTAATTKLVHQSLLFGLLVITGTFLASILFSRRITQNLQRLTVRAQALGEGDLTTEISVHSRDEVQDLASSFNFMMHSLKESRDKIEKHNRELEGKVQQRTLQLKEKNIALEEMQEKLIRSTQLAAVGEVAGRTAHEVVNPLTAALTRLEHVSHDQLSKVHRALPQQFTEILDAWEKDYKAGEWKSYWLPGKYPRK